MLPSIAEQESHDALNDLLNDPEELLKLLEFHAGNVNAMLSHLSKDANERQRMHYKVLKTVESSAEVHKKWKKSLARSQKARIQMLQCSALNNLERYDPFIHSFNKEGEPVVTLKQLNDIANAKLILGPAFEREMLQVKTSFKGASNSSADLSGEDTEEEDEALADAESDG